MDLLIYLEDNDEDVALYDYILNAKTRVYHYVDKEPGVFKLEDLGDSYCYTHFRFYKAQIRQLIDHFNIPAHIILKSRVNVGSEEAMCILLKRLAYPARYVDLMKYFPRGRSALGEIFNYMVDFILREKGHILKNLDQSWLAQGQIEQLCESLNQKGSPYKRCFGFIDGTVRAICRPTYHQREFYSGYKRVHSIKFQSLMLPNGIITNMFGSVVGRRHDGHVLAKSKLIQQLERKFNGWEDSPYLYGDSGYPLKNNLIVPYKGRLTRREKIVNKKMSKLRVAVEWGFAKILQLFPFVDFKKNQKYQKQNVARFYKVATLLSNCHTCLYGSQVCTYFECDPPGLDEYLN